MVLGTEPREDLQALTALIESGKINPVIDRSYPLSEAAGRHPASAHRCPRKARHHRLTRATNRGTANRKETPRPTTPRRPTGTRHSCNWHASQVDHAAQTGRQPGNYYRTTARIVGVLYLAGMVVGIGGNILIQSILTAPDSCRRSP